MSARAPRRPLRVAPIVLGCVLAATLLLGCNGSGDGGVGGTGQFLETGATYTSNAAMIPTDARPYVDLVQSSDQRTSFCLDVVVHRVLDLYSVSFTLGIDPAQATLRSTQVGSGLGSPTDLLSSVSDDVPGLIVVGVTRQLAVHGMTGVTLAEGTVITLCFDIVGEGDSAVDFVPTLALEDPNGVELTVSGNTATWVEGTLSTR